MRLSRFLRIQNPWSLFSKARWCCLKGGKRWCRRILCLWYLQFTRWGLKSTAQHPGCCSLSPVNNQEKKLNYLNLSGGIRQAALPRRGHRLLHRPGHDLQWAQEWHCQGTRGKSGIGMSPEPGTLCGMEPALDLTLQRNARGQVRGASLTKVKHPKLLVGRKQQIPHFKIK